MSWYTVRLILSREVRDQLRDRRTLLTIVVMPLLLYPLLGIGMAQVGTVFQQEVRTVLVVGAENLPRRPPLVVGHGFAPELFPTAAEASLLRVETAPVAKDPDETARRAAVRTGLVQVVIDVPSGFRAAVARQVGPAPGSRAAEAAVPAHLSITYDSADDKSLVTYHRVEDVLSKWQDEILPRPIHWTGEDLASEREAAGSVWARFIPFLLVMMSLAGAFNPAVDISAGEKERGTMETLLISPASRGEIVLAKFLTVLVFSVTNAILNLASMALTGWQIAARLPQGQHERTAATTAAVLALPGWDAALWMLALLIPLAAFFSALCLAIASFARSTKEAQYYLTPLLLIVMPLSMVTMAPGVELKPVYSIIPVAGVALLLKALLVHRYAAGQVVTLVLRVMIPTLVYCYLALRWAVDQFRQETILFREAERLDLRLWVRHLLTAKPEAPSVGEALFCYATIILLMWFLGPWAGRPDQLGQITVVTQLAFIAAPPLILAVLLTRDPRRTLRLRWPAPPLLAGGLLLAVTLHPWVVEINRHVQGYLPLPPQVRAVLERFLGPHGNLGWQIVVAALVPAVCEELACRGFVLSGLLSRHRPATAIVLTALLFGFLHLNLQQFVGASLLGLVLGLLAYTSQSLLPAMVFHFTNNALLLVLQRVASAPLGARSWIGGFVRRGDTEFSYTAPVLIGSALLSGLILGLIARRFQRMSREA